MSKNHVLSFALFFLVVGYFILNKPENVFAGLAPIQPVSNCCDAHEGTGCDDSQCEDQICSIDEFCCVTSWDSTCADEALSDCRVCRQPLAENIPTLNEWGLIALAGILGIVGFMVIRRRKATA